MKKFIIIAIIAISLIVTYSPKDFVSLTKNLVGENAVYEFFAKGIDNAKVNKFNTENKNPSAIRVYSNGLYEVALSNKASAKVAKDFTEDIKGYSVKFKGNYDDFNNIQKKFGLSICERQNLEGLIIVYGFSAKMPNHITLNGQKVNMELSIKNDGTVCISSPINLGSY